MVVALLTAAACGSPTDQPAEDTSGTDPAPVALEPPARLDTGEAPEVRLLDAGGGERRVLSYSPADPAAIGGRREGRDGVEVSYSRRSSASVAGAEPTRDDTPTQRLSVRTVTEPGVDGAVRSTMTVQGFDSDDELRSRQFATADGFVVNWVRSAAGVVSETTLEAPERATDAARAGVEVTVSELAAAAVVFPADAVGVGARWQVTRTVGDAVARTRVDTYRLTALDGRTATVTVDTGAPIATRRLTSPSPGGGPDITLDVDAYEFDSSGEFVVDLRSALPVSGTTRSRTRAVYSDPTTHSASEFDSETELHLTSAGQDLAG